MRKNDDNRDLTGTIRLAGAATILFVTVAGYLWNPFGDRYLSAGLLGGVAAISYAMRGLFVKKKQD
ncbi:MAG: hypothetical protein JJ926_02450 [Roseitalea sp.]|jgi:hypothetical protein|uniref:Uncharacterized protein n=1 Tax=Oceaniradius stylonematis TaxID=2184161 RepID=A0A3A8ACU6_9HYPH|nr:hypothetical protein [Oceaniradius stylonematis]MBO6552361.1 hypothetical protein [Roseitalea sp.]MBO6950719.1 hypothetical protein [Rhizobiaceae bacterium]RNC95103.1 MAG: hypothetical protein ED558_10150 [Oricola sp.]MBO6591294.1 hypothetical protein [Roseitalea sp.]MBO6599149.1 hypothetical protein [Roseitalea sp.]